MTPTDAYDYWAILRSIDEDPVIKTESNLLWGHTQSRQKALDCAHRLVQLDQGIKQPTIEIASA